MAKDYTNRDLRIYCQKCKYPMVRLRGFEGKSSNQSNRDFEPENYGGFGGRWRLGMALLTPLFDELTSYLTKSHYKKLQAGILPEFPASLICPRCKSVTKKK